MLRKENNFVLIYHGSEYYKCLPCYILNNGVKKKLAKQNTGTQYTNETKEKKMNTLNADSCSDDESKNEVETEVLNCESGSVSDINYGTNANSEVVDKSADLEVVDKTDINVESGGESKANVDENPETRCKFEVQITDNDESQGTK